MLRALGVAAVAAAILPLSSADAAAILNGTFTVSTSSSQIGTVNDSNGFTNLTLTSGVPQSTDLFDIFSVAPVTSQQISVSFSFTQTGIGPISATVIGTVSASSDADDTSMVSFVPAIVQVPSYGRLSISLSGAQFASDFNGTVTATFVETVPEPSSAAVLGFGALAAVAGFISGGRRQSVFG